MQELIIEFLFGPKGFKLGIAPMAISAVAQGIGGLLGAFGAKKRARQAGRAAKRYEADLARLEANRQDVVNPYANVSDLSSMVTNPFANLQVATKASEMQARESDISLASTLDAVRAMGGGGATALAQAASRAKQGVAASIEQQEAKNAELRAQGEQAAQRARMAETARFQGLEAAGKQFVFQQQEQRELMQLDRVSGLAEQNRALQAQQQSAASQGFGQALGAAAGIGASFAGGINPFTGELTGK